MKKIFLISCLLFLMNGNTTFAIQDSVDTKKVQEYNCKKSYDTISCNKKYITKRLLLKKRELQNFSSQGKVYIQAIDTFIEKNKNNTEKLTQLIERVSQASKKLGLNQKKLKLILEYIEHKSELTLLGSSENSEEEYEDKISSAKVSSDVRTLVSIIETWKTGQASGFGNIIKETISEKKSSGAESILGYPNYQLLGIDKDDFLDGFGNEYIIAYNYVKDETYGEQYFYQILGYAQSGNSQKIAIIKGNYVRRNDSYPISLFIDSETGLYIENLDTFGY